MIINSYGSTKINGITSEEAVKAVGNRYYTILIASQRARELKQKNLHQEQSSHNACVSALMDIEQGRIGLEYLLKNQTPPPRQKRRRF